MNQTLQPIFVSQTEALETMRQELEPVQQFQQIMMLYESAVKQVAAKLEVLRREYEVCGRRSPIENIKTRIKSPQSIAEKLQRRGLDLSYASMVNDLDDIAGVRVICPYISDIYTVRDTLTSQGDIVLLKEKDYIRNPKPNGYRSLHLILEIPVYLSHHVQAVRVELQIRTIAMDFWASLEHELRYKSQADIPEILLQELQECAEVIAQTDRRMEEIARQVPGTEMAHVRP